MKPLNITNTNQDINSITNQFLQTVISDINYINNKSSSYTVEIIGIVTKTYGATFFSLVDINNDKAVINVQLHKNINYFAQVGDQLKVIGNLFLFKRSKRLNEGDLYNQANILVNLYPINIELMTSNANIVTQQQTTKFDIKKSNNFFPHDAKSKLNIAVIHSKSEQSAGKTDFINKFIGNNKIEITAYPVIISSKQEIVDKLGFIQQSDFDIVVIARGGEDKSNVFNDLDICNLFGKINAHKMVAIGHAEDGFLIGLCADYVADVPKDLTNYLAHNLKILESLKQPKFNYNNSYDKPKPSTPNINMDYFTSKFKFINVLLIATCLISLLALFKR